ncbi:alpha/beta fold hydrolase [Marinobacter zhejiangensis]|uniref:Pimeloyl-ACP methyl ester carboxylesterase n=1 Tax=Marinobacter zhejiangensis TaxID=488535 RepID=A0A1I4P133_9GAMM|nr:alpha/beta hydrolase [Marinobacter zhejiangensis]SFM21511.1 Pimeloyl-ACP methyl ester carboxylesterase [Marinobacter zhejiangensis]
MNNHKNDMNQLRQYFDHRGYKLSYLDTHPGDASRPVVLLIHGFPDTAVMWSEQIRFLVDAGYRCLAPDTLGCGDSELGRKLDDYNVFNIIAHHIALLDHLNIERADVVGHDWGAVQAWFLAAYHPTRLKTLTVVSVGHPTAYARAGLRQMVAGWYIAYFNLRGISERLLAGKGRLSLRSVFRSHPDMDEVMGRFSEPGRLVAALNLYRANLITVLTRSHPKVTVPTLGVWSEGDDFLVEKQMRDSEKWMAADWSYQRTGGAHWVPITEPGWLNSQILEHLAKGVA